MLQSLLETVLASFNTLWEGFVAIIPSLVAAFLVLVIGWAIAVVLARLVEKIIHALWIEHAVEKLRVKEMFSEIGIKFSFAELIGWLVKWFLLIVVFIAAADILGLSQITVFLQSVVLYIPNVIIAVVIVLLGVLIGSFTGDVVHRAIKTSKLHSGEAIGGIAKWAIIVFAFMAGLMQLGIAAEMTDTLFKGIVSLIALAGGIAFGLGGRDTAEHMLGVLKKDLTKQ